MKDEKRAHDLVRNLPTRMLKSFDQNKFNILKDKAFHYDESSYLELINMNIKKNMIPSLCIEQMDRKSSNKTNMLTFSCSPFVERF